MPSETPPAKTSRQMASSSFPRRTVSGVVAPLLGLGFGLASACKPKEGGGEASRAWNAANDPVILRGNRMLERRLSKLPQKEEVKKERSPWADTYWPSRVGGIAARWNSPQHYAFQTVLVGQADVQRMTLRERAQLSPAEKYDIFMGNYSYPLTTWEKLRTSPDALDWEGLCHGVAAASLVFEEPKPVVVKNPQGIDVPFGSADIKGLLALYVGYVAQNDVKSVGQRCPPLLPPNNNGTDIPVNVGTGFGRESLTECEDVNAGSFHLILGNVIGLQQETVIADITAGEEVWNHPIISYSAKETGERPPQATAAPGTVREKLMETQVRYMVRGIPSWKRENARIPISEETITYRYALELNAEGEIIGGEWLQPEYPDFLWKQAKPEFQFYFYKLKDLVEASSKSRFDDDLTFL